MTISVLIQRYSLVAEVRPAVLATICSLVAAAYIGGYWLQAARVRAGPSPAGAVAGSAEA
jgi:hypothetical protein